MVVVGSSGDGGGGCDSVVAVALLETLSINPNVAGSLLHSAIFR